MHPSVFAKKSLWYALLPFAFACSGGSSRAAEPQGPIVLPIEVFGADGATRVVQIPLTEEARVQSHALRLKLHNVRYLGKVSVQVNNSPWVPLRNDNTVIEEPGRSFGGIGGGSAVLFLSVPMAEGVFQEGMNAVRFRFDKTNGLSMGFRVLGIDVVNEAGAGLVSPGTFVQDDPATWTAPPGADAEAGKTLWYTATLTEGAMSTAHLRAACTDCHATDGRDLKYFAYSNFSIIERAKFHGLSEMEGQNIAAYIRGIPVEVHGRPWNPPFQPGPGMSQKPVAAWSAGAGVEASMVTDEETLDAIFSSGYDRAALADGNALKRISAQDIPVGFQLPDWNHWLPEIHPKESLGDAYETTAFHTKFTTLHRRLSEHTPEQREAFRKNTFDAPDGKDGARHAFGSFTGEVRGLANLVSGRVENAPFEWTDLSARQVYAAGVLTQVRAWQLMNEFALEDYAPSAYPEGETRAWFSERSLFDTSPFLMGIGGKPSCPNGEKECGLRFTGSSSGNTLLNFEYIGNAWYHLQLITNAGQRKCGGHQCIDWGYAYGFVQGLLGPTGRYEGGRRLLWSIKGMDEHDFNNGPKFYDGFSLATANPLRPLSLDKPEVIAWWLNPEHPKRRQALEVTLQVWLEKLASFSLDDWKKNYGEHEDGANFMDATRVVGEDSPETNSRSLGDGIWRTVAAIKPVLPPAFANGLARFGAALWPANDWVAHASLPAGSAPAAPGVSATGATVEVTWNAVPDALSYNVLRSESATGPWLTVAYSRNGASTTDIVPAVGKTWHYAVTANTSTAESPLSLPTAVMTP